MDINEKYLFNGDGHADLYKSLFLLIARKDRYTGWHCRNVAALALLIAEEAGLPDNELHLVYTAGLLHDIGKLMVDSTILLKPSNLTEKEFLKIRTHPTEGALILEDFHADRNIIDGAWHHHERWDGRGYPDGLEKNGTTFMTRIITIADCYDAMASERPYHDAMPPDKVREQFVNGRENQFDPLLTDMMLEILDKKQEDTIIEYLLA